MSSFCVGDVVIGTKRLEKYNGKLGKVLSRNGKKAGYFMVQWDIDQVIKSYASLSLKKYHVSSSIDVDACELPELDTLSLEEIRKEEARKINSDAAKYKVIFNHCLVN